MTAALVLAGAALWVGALFVALSLCRAAAGAARATRPAPRRRRTSRPPLKEWLI